MNGEDQTAPDVPAGPDAPLRELGWRRLAFGAALCLLVVVAGLRLGRHELSTGEARFAQGALGALEHDRRGDAPAFTTSADGRLLSAWAAMVGTTERPLRALPVLALLLAALVTGTAAARLAPPGAGPIPLLMIAATPLLQRSELLYPGMTAALPAALALGSIVYLRRGSPWWAVAVLLGVALATALGTFVLLVVLGIVAGSVLAIDGAGVSRRLVVLAAAGAGGTVRGRGLFDAWEASARAPLVGEPAAFDLVRLGGGELIGLVGAAVLGILLVLGSLRATPRRRVEIALLAGTAASLVAILAFGDRSQGALRTAAVSAFLPGLALLVALAVASLPRAGRLGAATALVILVGLTPDLGTRLRATVPPSVLAAVGAAPPPAFRPGPMREVLARARLAARPGGRLVVSGPSRYGILFYSRRGHDPGVPVLLVPDDVAPDQLVPVLRERLGVRDADSAAAAPSILITPPPPTTPAGARIDVLPAEGGAPPLAELRFDAPPEDGGR